MADHFKAIFHSDSGGSFRAGGGMGVQWGRIIGKPSEYPPGPHTHPDLAPLDTPAFTGEPTAPTPPEGDNSTRLATTAFVREYTQAELPLRVVYGVTPYSEVLAAFNAGRYIYAVNEQDSATRVYYLASSALTGDVTKDGLVNGDDVTRLARHVGKIQYLTDPQALINADTNFDGKVDARDQTRLARIVSFSGTTTPHVFVFVSFDSISSPACHVLYLGPESVWVDKSYDMILSSSIASAFAPDDYDIGDYVLYHGELYKAISAVSETDGWKPAQWQKTSVMAELEAL